MNNPDIFGRLGLSGYFFRNNRSLEFIGTCVALGLRGVDLWPWNYDLENIKGFGEQLRNAELTVISHNIPGATFRLGEPLDAVIYNSKIRPIVEAARTLNCTSLQMYCATPASGLPADGVSMLVNSLRQLMEMLPDEMSIFIENNLDQRGDDPQGANPSRSSESLGRVLSELKNDRISVCFDATNFLTVGEDPVGSFKELKESVGLIHVKDCLPYEVELHAARPESKFLLRDHKCGEFLPTVVGSGSVDWVSLHQVMNHHYSDKSCKPWVVIDPFIHDDLLDWWCIQSVAAVRDLTSARRTRNAK